VYNEKIGERLNIAVHMRLTPNVGQQMAGN